MAEGASRGIEKNFGLARGAYRKPGIDLRSAVYVSRKPGKIFWRVLKYFRKLC